MKGKTEPRRNADYISRARKVDAEAKELKKRTHDLHRPEIEEYVRKNPLSPAIAASLLHGVDADKARKGGKKAAQAIQRTLVERDKNIWDRYNAMPKIEQHFAAPMLAQRFNISAQRVRAILRKMRVR